MTFKEEALQHRYRQTAVILLAALIIGFALRELWPIFSGSQEDKTGAALLLSGGLMFLACGLARCKSLKSERQKVAEILESI